MTTPASLKESQANLTKERRDCIQVCPVAADRTDSSHDDPPDGGYGWVCAVAAAVVNAHSWGFNSAYAVFLAYYLKNNIFPGASRLEYAFVGSLSLTTMFLLSPVATMSTRRYGIRKTMFVGVILESASLISASFASQIWHLFLTQGLLFGMGMGMLFIPVASVVPQWFTSKRSLASGVSLSGAGLGGFVYSLVTEAMIRNIGLSWAFRVLGLLAFTVNTTCVLLIRDRNKTVKVGNVAIDFALFNSTQFDLLLGFSFFTILGYFILIYSLANYGEEIGLSSSQASLVSGIFNLGQAVGRPIIGYFSDTVGRVNIAGFTTFLAGVICLAVWVNAESYGLLIFFAIFEGLFAGNIWATIAPLVAEVVGLDRVSRGMNIVWLCILNPATFSEPIALELTTATGKYLGAQLFAGFMYITASAFLAILWFQRRS
ncbi:uncharacterized protein N7484_001095 [Penicillium longicatenatum]|uniref:uncharacterized protein n=1 Tax=Penicillium longicatenatum TaxID=1561947 RepID=UPI002547690A|nr:uncharacterized protein N7484_001095 [Penicillium longicatenatum]KAJ5657446.1 hypothetical protein N7484_001095 [Penicillium longicatenatum]